MVITDLEVQDFFKKNNMGKYYENLDDLNKLVKKLDKKNGLSEFILSCLIIAKEFPQMSIHEIIKKSKEKWD